MDALNAVLSLHMNTIAAASKYILEYQDNAEGMKHTNEYTEQSFKLKLNI